MLGLLIQPSKVNHQHPLALFSFRTMNAGLAHSLSEGSIHPRSMRSFNSFFHGMCPLTLKLIFSMPIYFWGWASISSLWCPIDPALVESCWQHC